MPGNSPRYVRCYDNGGATADRYTVVFTGRYRSKNAGAFIYLAMNGAPFHPQGFCQHGDSTKQIDVSKHGFAPVVGRKNHLGTRVDFSALPADCQKVVIRDYRDIWDLNEAKIAA